MTSNANNQSAQAINRVLLALPVACLALFLVFAIMGDHNPNDAPIGPGAAYADPNAEWSSWIDEAAAGARDTIRNDDFAVTDDMLATLRRAESLETLILDRGVVTDASMDALAALPRLNHLRLRLSPITDDGLTILSKSKSLSILNLPHANCTAAGVAQLVKLSGLRQLRLGSNRLEDDVSKTLAKHSSLRSIHLIGVPITDDGLKQIVTLPNLKSLYLDDSAVTEAGWQWLFENHRDLHVHVDQHHHDRDPQPHQHDVQPELEQTTP